MALQRPGDVQGSELSGMRSTCLLGFKEPLVLFSDSLLGNMLVFYKLNAAIERGTKPDA
jgi:hypothetical protein